MPIYESCCYYGCSSCKPHKKKLTAREKAALGFSRYKKKRVNTKDKLLLPIDYGPPVMI